MAVNFVTSVKLPTQIVHPAVETDPHHQVPTTPHFFGFTESTSKSRARQNFHLGHFLSPQYLHPPNNTQKINPSTENPSTASVMKANEANHATPSHALRTAPPDAQKFSRVQNSEQRNIFSTLSPQYFFPPNSTTFESRKEGMAQIIFPPSPQDQPPDARVLKAQSRGGVTPRVVTQWSIISKLYFLRFSQRHPFIFSIV